LAVKTPVLESHININIIIKVNLRKIMNKLNKILVLAMFSMASLVSNVSADSSIFAGPYVAIQASVVGVEVDGSHTDSTLDTKKTTNATPGMVGNMGSAQVGFNQALSELAFITAGLTYTPTGDAKFAAKSLGGTVASFDLTLSDIKEVFIEPSFMVTSNAAVFLHLGMSEADISVKGSDVTNKTTTLDGQTIALGLKLVTDTNVFIKAEGGMTTFDNLKVTGILDGDGGSTATAKGDPTVAFGTVSVGYKF